jgi:hypothetical protein
MTARAGTRRERLMSTTITGVVTNGVVVPSSPLPEGEKVEIRLQPVRAGVSLEIQEEFDDWERAGAGTVEMIERLADEMEAVEKR